MGKIIAASVIEFMYCNLVVLEFLNFQFLTVAGLSKNQKCRLLRLFGFS